MQPEAEAIIIGAGPAGLMAAETLAAAGRRVAIYERMPSPGRKFLLAGRGGLNLTHGEDPERFLTRYPDCPAALRASIEAFGPDALRTWAAGLGEETFVGSSGRVFPKSFKASPLLRAWLRRLQSLGVTLHTRHRWHGWDDAGNLVFDRSGEVATVPAPAATILALGGASWPRLGSDGGWAESLAGRGVAVSPLVASNVGVRIAWTDIFAGRFAGEPLKRIALSVGRERRRGEAVVTRLGLEGGAVYALSGALRQALAGDGTARLVVDLRPDGDAADLAARLARRGKGQSLSTHLRKALALPPVAIGLLREAFGAALPEEPARLADAVKAVPLTVRGLDGLERAISSAGGIAFADLDERMMLKRMPGTFVAGEMLDWDAPTGGYLLQASFATGVSAAQGALSWIDGRSDRRGATSSPSPP